MTRCRFYERFRIHFLILHALTKITGKYISDYYGQNYGMFDHQKVQKYKHLQASKRVFTP
jgi:hypothetical protein